MTTKKQVETNRKTQRNQAARKHLRERRRDEKRPEARVGIENGSFGLCTPFDI